MRILNRAHIPWFFFVVLATAIAGWIYLGNFSPAGLPAGLSLPPALHQQVSGHRSPGGTPIGLVFGIVSFAIFIFGGLLSLRKRIVLWRVGTIKSWMRAHIWLTLLTIPLVLFHCGFRLGTPMTTLLMALYAVVMVSGIYGLILQQRIPLIMQERLPSETVYQQIPYIRSQLFLAAERMRNSFKASVPPVLAPVSSIEPLSPLPEVVNPESESALITFLEDQVMPYLHASHVHGSGLGNSSYADDAFRFVKLKVGDSYVARVEEIQSWCDQRRTLDLQTRLHHWLHAWLFVHVPFSFLLILLTAWHAVITLFYY